MCFFFSFRSSIWLCQRQGGLHAHVHQELLWWQWNCGGPGLFLCCLCQQSINVDTDRCIVKFMFRQYKCTTVLYSHTPPTPQWNTNIHIIIWFLWDRCPLEQASRLAWNTRTNPTSVWPCTAMEPLTRVSCSRPTTWPSCGTCPVCLSVRTTATEWEPA